MEHALETERLRLRPCRADDAAPLREFWAGEHVRRFLFDGREVSDEEAREFVARSLEAFARHGLGLWLAFEAEAGARAVAFAGFLVDAGEPPSLVYGVRPEACGRGYATEAARAVLDYALGVLRLPRVRADVDEPNAASVRVLEKLGMTRTSRAEVEGRPLLYFEARARQTT
jgi:ribosomal-protein-alanine N-acetyltransferase